MNGKVFACVYVYEKVLQWIEKSLYMRLCDKVNVCSGDVSGREIESSLGGRGNMSWYGCNWLYDVEFRAKQVFDGQRTKKSS